MFYGWRLLAGLSTIYFLAIGLALYGIGLVIPHMIEHYGWTRTQASAGFAILTLVYGLAGPLVAWVINRIGVRWTISLGGLISSAGALITFQAQSLWQYYFGAGVVLGLGLAFQTVIPGIQLISRWFARRRSLAMGIFLASGGLGGLAMIPASAYIESSGNWQSMWLAMAGATFLASILALWVVKERPEDVGQFVDGIDPEITPRQSSRSGVHITMTDWEVADVVRSPSFWIIILAGSFVVLGITIVNSQLVLHLTDLGISAVLAGSAIGIQASVSAVARLFSGGLGDQFEPRYLLAIGLICELAGVLVLNIATEPFWVYLFIVLFGIGNGMATVACTTLLVNFFGIKNNASLMAIRGIAVTLLGALGPITAGYMADELGSYYWTFNLYAMLAIMVTVGVLLMRAPYENDLAKAPV